MTLRYSILPSRVVETRTGIGCLPTLEGVERITEILSRADLTYPVGRRQWRWDAQGGRCYLCLNPVPHPSEKVLYPPRASTRDHVLPRSAGGTDGGNILLACQPCNGRKADRIPRACELVFLWSVNLRMLGELRFTYRPEA